MFTFSVIAFSDITLTKTLWDKEVVLPTIDDALISLNMYSIQLNREYKNVNITPINRYTAMVSLGVSGEYRMMTISKNNNEKSKVSRSRKGRVNS